MDAWILPTIFNAVLGIIAYLLKTQIDEMKIQLKDARMMAEKNRDEVQKVRDEYLNKGDFRDFKDELYRRMDKNHEDLVRQITQAH